MTPDELRICNVVDTLIRKNRSFALWRIPGESPRFAMQTSGSARILYHIEELDEQSGFVIAPFHVSKQHPIVLIRPDIQKLPPDEETKVSYSMPAEQEFHHSETLVSFPENPKEDYSRRFNAFIEPLRRKQFEKLVLSRCQTIPADRANFSPAAAFLKATGRYKYSYVYLCHTPATGTWLGCTPEIILSGEKGKWHTVAHCRHPTSPKRGTTDRMGRQKQGRTGICSLLHTQTTASIRYQTDRNSSDPGTRRRTVAFEKRLQLSTAR